MAHSVVFSSTTPVDKRI